MSEQQKASSNARTADGWMPWVLAAVAVFVLSFQLGTRELASPDETRYAAISRSMVDSGDWLTPVHNFKFKHWHKPPLTYWLMAASFRVLGTNDWAARVPSAAAALATVMGVYVIGLRLHGRRSGFLAGLVLLASPLFFALARLANADMLLCAFITWSWAAFVLSLFGRRRQTLWFLLGAAFAGLGFMTKGPVVLMSTLVPMLLYALLANQWKRIGWWRPLAAVGVFLVVALPWYVAVCMRNPGLLRYFVEYQTFQRVATHLHERTEPFTFFFWLVPLGFLPWTVVLPFGVWGSLRRRGNGSHTDRLRACFSLSWFAVVFAFITLSTSKLATYCLPLFPALALMAGLFIRRVFEEDSPSRLARKVLIGTAFVLLIMSGFAAMLRPAAPPDSDQGWLTTLHVVSGLGMFLIGLAAILVFSKGRWAAGTCWLVAGVLFPLLLSAWIVAGHEDELGIGNPGNELAALIQERVDTDRYREVVAVMYRRYLKELPYYLGHSVICLDCHIELDYELPDGRKASFYTEEERSALYDGYYRENGRNQLDRMMRLKSRRLLVVTDRESFDDISTSFMEDDAPLVHFIAEVGEFVLCSNHPDTPPEE